MLFAQSPYQTALNENFDQLHPQLREYFAAIPEGSVGIGNGVFDTVGTPRRWLHPLIRFFAGSDVVFPVWEHAVPFTVVNTPTTSSGGPAVSGRRVFRFASGDRVMNDLIVASADGLFDILGRRRRLRAQFAANILDGCLHLSSTGVDVRFGTRQVRIPRMLSPRVHLIERFSDDDHHQHVDVRMSLPLIGKIYEYSGSFRYQVKVGGV